MNKLQKLINLYKRGKKISCITAYDASFSKYLDAMGIDIILVGDSLGQVIKGEKSTHNVSLGEIIYHSKCVKSGLKNSLLMVDLPKGTFKNKPQALKNSLKLVSNGIADLIKIEVGPDNLKIIEYLVSKNIPLCAHIGLLPQTITTKSEYRKYGKSKKEADTLYNLALQLTQIGVDIILLECLHNDLAKRISLDCSVPVIGIGSGNKLDGQVAVIYDLLGVSYNVIDSFITKRTSSLDTHINKFKKLMK